MKPRFFSITEMKKIKPSPDKVAGDSSDKTDTNQNEKENESGAQLEPDACEEDALLEEGGIERAGSSKCKGKLTRQGATTTPAKPVENV